MTQRKKGITQHISAMKAGISVRSGRRIEKGEWAKTKCSALAHTQRSSGSCGTACLFLCWKEAGSDTNNSAGDAQDKYPGQYPNSLEEQCNSGSANGRPVWCRAGGHVPSATSARSARSVGLTELKGVAVTIAGKLLAHKLYHFRLEWSHWSWMRLVLGGESFSALAEGLQEALGQLGGVPAEHKTDSLRAAWKQQGEDGRRELTERYAALCQHYGMQGVHNNAGRGHEKWLGLKVPTDI